MRSPVTPPIVVTHEKAMLAKPSIPLHSTQKAVDWLKATVHDIVVSQEKCHTVRIEIMRRKPGIPASVVQNESSVVTFTIDSLHTPNTVFDAEALMHIEHRQQPVFESTSCTRLSLSLGMIAELKVSCDPDGSNVSAILVFATYGGGYYAQHSQVLPFRDITVEP